ncbi:hypothetical protein KJ652_06945 [Patescibacteria group bacterium]|nr:hypothetical protein [Patescibacteria group bacterium]MBU1124286.1 hypothetical protein [Patescibacteria group bacterium]MBU1911532.1 hypothetical protein [Patescibacteria group bacterium]
METINAKFGLKERRFAYYESHLGRFVGTTKDYDPTNPFQLAAAATHVVTAGFGLDPAIRDAARAVDGGKVSIPPYGQFGRTRGNIADTLDNALHLKPFSTIAGLINVVGDGIADGADFLVDVNHKRGGVRSKVDKVLAV